MRCCSSIITGSSLSVLLVLSIGCESNRAVGTIGSLSLGDSGSGVADGDVSTGGRISCTGVSPEVAAILDEGQQALDNSQWRAAEQKFNEVLRSAPGNAEAQQGREIARAYMDQGSTLDQVAAEIRLRRESTLAEFDAALLNAAAAIKTHEFVSARVMLLSATNTLERNRQYLSVTERTSPENQGKRLLAESDEWEELIRATRSGSGRGP